MGAPRPTSSRQRPPRGRDAGAIVLGWLVRITVLLVAVSVVGFDVASLGLNSVQADDAADKALKAAQLSWQTSHDPAVALSSARAAVDTGDGQVTVPDKSFSIDAQGRIQLTVHRRAHTIVLDRVAEHVKQLDKYLSADSVISSR